MTLPDCEPYKLISTTDARWTTIPFVDANGLPVLCAVILKCERLNAMHLLGIDIFCDWPEDFRDLHKHTGKGKLYPEGPTCVVRGVVVKCFVTCSPEGGITPEILVEILTYLDSLNIFPRGKNLIPHLVTDGHDTRLNPKVVRYIFNPTH